MKKQNQDKQLRPEEEGRTFGKGLSFAAAESYRLLRANVLFALPDEKQCRIIGVTSSMRGGGKSTTALNLAYMLAESGRKTLLVEADMRLPTAARRLGLPGKQGLSDLLVGMCSGGDILQMSGIHEKLWIMSAGSIPPNPSELLGSHQMRQTIEHLSRGFDFILLDLPPVNEVSDSLVASKLTDGMLMVVREGYAARSAVSAALRQLQYVEAKVLGFVLTRTDGQGGKYKYKKGYGYGGQYSTARTEQKQ